MNNVKALYKTHAGLALLLLPIDPYTVMFGLVAMGGLQFNVTLVTLSIPVSTANGSLASGLWCMKTPSV